MNHNQRKILTKIAVMVLGILVVSAYISGVFHALINGYGTPLSPVSVVHCVLTHGFPFGLFVAFLLVFAAMGAYAFLYQLREFEGMDKMGRLFRLAQKRKGYGSSHFEEPKEYQKAAVIQSPDDAYGTILGQLDDSGKNLINFRMDDVNRLNQHIAIAGASGSGKTYTFSKNYCFQAVKRRESIVVTDPDGGLYRDMAGYFKDNGYVVRRFDLVNLKKSDGWNCLKSVGGDELNSQLFAHAVIANLVEELGSIYGVGPMALLKALVLRVALGKEYEPERKNIQSVYELLQNPDGETYLDAMFDPNSLTAEELPCLGPYLAFKQSSPNLRGNLIANLAIQLQLLQNSLVCQVLSTDDIDMELLAQQPCAYFCIFPDSHDTFQFVVALFFSMLFTTLIAYADQQENGRCPVPVNFLLDEFPSIGTIPDFDRKMATIRKRALNVAIIFQDMSQLMNNYKDSWITLLSNCSTFLSLGINDEKTADWATRRIGETTIEVQTEQHAAMESLFTIYRPKSTGEGRRSLLSYDELFKLDENESIILFQYHNPIWARKVPHTLHPEAKKLRTILPKDIPDITEVAARAEMRARESAYIKKYLAEHPLEGVSRDYTGLCNPTSTPNPFDGVRKQVKKSWKKARKKAANQRRSPRSTLGANAIPVAKRAEKQAEVVDVVSECDFIVEATSTPIAASQSGVDERVAQTPSSHVEQAQAAQEKPPADTEGKAERQAALDLQMAKAVTPEPQATKRINPKFNAAVIYPDERDSGVKKPPAKKQ